MTTTVRCRLVAGLSLLLFWWACTASAAPGIGQMQPPGDAPDEYRTNVAVLETALRMNDRWSAVWSERLVGLADDVPDPGYCVKLIGPEEDGEAVVDPFVVVKTIATECAYSGLYVRFGVRVLAQSLRCVFYRHARHQMAVVTNGLDGADHAFVEYLGLLVADYRLVADKLVAVGASIRHLVKMAMFLHDVSELMPSIGTGQADAEKLRKDLQKKAKTLSKAVDELFTESCAVGGSKWYDDERGVFVDFKDTKVKKNKKKKKDKDEGEDGDGGDEEKKKEETPLIAKANEMRLVMRRVFGDLLIEEMPEEVWKQIFDENILMTDIDFQSTSVEDKHKLKVKKGIKPRL